MLRLNFTVQSNQYNTATSTTGFTATCGSTASYDLAKSSIPILLSLLLVVAAAAPLLLTLPVSLIELV